MIETGWVDTVSMVTHHFPLGSVVEPIETVTNREATKVSYPRVVATHQRFLCHSLAFPRTASGVRPRVQRPVWARSVL
jgi:hypothetical protein